VDMRAANQAIVRERHPMPTVDEIPVDLNGSKYLSKLDLNQLEIDEESRSITTFTSHIVLKRYRRLNFGVSCASEVFQSA